MKSIVGLGNPGSKYRNTRHNIGFMILDRLVAGRKIKWKRDKLFHYAVDNEALYLKPSTFMNLSGEAVLKALKKYHFSSLLTVFDDIYLPLGQIRIREKGSAGGHKGVKSIINLLGKSEFTRLRIGIGSPDFTGLSEYVLTDFTREEIPILNETKNFACLLIEQFIIGDYKQMIDCYSKNSVSYFEKINEISKSKTKGGNE